MVRKISLCRTMLFTVLFLGTFLFLADQSLARERRYRRDWIELAEGQSSAKDEPGWWVHLPEEQKSLMRRKQRKWKRMDEKKKKKLKERYEEFQSLPDDEKEKIRSNWHKYNNLSERQKRRLKERHERFKNLSVEEKRRLRKKYTNLKKLADEKRDHLRSRNRRSKEWHKKHSKAGWHNEQFERIKGTEDIYADEKDEVTEE